MNKVFLSLGSNLNNRIYILNQAKKQINKQIGKVIKETFFYESEAWGFETDNLFINTVVEIETSLSAKNILEKCLSIEQLLGRARNPLKKGYSSRTIDIDILFFNHKVLNEPNLQIPHKLLHLRKFVLLPLNDIATDFIHPLLKQSVKKLLQNCSDNSFIQRITF